MRQRNAGSQPYFGTYHQAKPCECGKRGYPDRTTAKAVIREMRRQGKVRTDRIDAYRCLTDPDFWHVGHRPDSYIGQNLNDPEGVDGVNRHQRNRAARLARRVLVEGRLVAPLPEERHGLQSSYTNWGCRCMPCTEANTGVWRGYYRTYLAKGSEQLRQEGRVAA